MKGRLAVFGSGIVAFLWVGWEAPLASRPYEVADSPRGVVDLLAGQAREHLYTWLVDDHYEDPLRVFSYVDAVDGGPALRISGERWGGVATRRNFRDYRLVAEFRWGLLSWGDRRDRARDSGILIHCQGRDGNTGPDFNGPWMASVEVQIIEGGTGDLILVGGHGEEGETLQPGLRTTVSRDRDGEWVYDPWGKWREFRRGRINWFARDPDWEDRLGFRGKRDVESPSGQWNQLEIVCRGNEITSYLNGRLVNRARDLWWTEGKIMIQSEGAEIFFRRLELHPLAP